MKALMIMSSGTQFSFEVLEALDDVWRCASVHHDADDAGVVDHGGVARFYVLGPCVHVTGLRCEPAVLAAMALAFGRCDRCRSVWPRERFTFWRL